jgi:hypothetical protein
MVSLLYDNVIARHEQGTAADAAVERLPYASREEKMAKIQIAREVLQRTKDRSNLTDAERLAVERLLGERGAKRAVTAHIGDYPPAFLKAMLDDPRLTPNQRAAVSMQVFGMTSSREDRDAIDTTPATNPVEFASTFVALGGKTPNCEHVLNGRWYPVTLGIQFLQDKEQIKGVLLQGFLSLCECTYALARFVYPDLFIDECGQPVSRLPFVRLFSLDTKSYVYADVDDVTP